MSLPPNKLSRVIINTDAKNEADDQYAIVQGLLTPSFELHGIIAAHFGSIKSKTSMQDSYDEVMKLLDLMALRGQVRVEKGAEGPITNEQTAADLPGARFIVEQGMKDDPRPLHVAFLGPLTDMASALLIEPQLARAQYPRGLDRRRRVAGGRARVQFAERYCGGQCGLPLGHRDLADPFAGIQDDGGQLCRTA